MFDRLDEWRARLQGRGAGAPRGRVERAAAAARGDGRDEPEGPRGIDDYGPCAVCGGGREIVMRPVGSDAARLGLVCAECGAATEI